MPAEQLEVWLDAQFCAKPMLVGFISNDHGQLRFQYAQNWLTDSSRFAIDPDLPLSQGVYFPKKDAGNFGCFLDGSPDRWGQTLMKRREMLEAQDEKRKPRNLYEWDFMAGVQDLTRQGALRLRSASHDQFVSQHRLSAPPLAQLAELELVAKELSHKRIDNLSALRRWLSVLVAPGASLGGARPKANFTQTDGSLWIAKFPSREDDMDIGGWEGVVHALALQARLDVPNAKVFKFGKYFHTFCVKRFDRLQGRRLFYASAMTLLGRQDSEGSSYVDLARLLLTQGNPATLKHDLEQLFRRVVFNVCVSNRDDHLRNHGFLFDGKNWRLSPAFDVNPNLAKADHVLNLDAVTNRPDLELVVSTASYYDLNESQAQKIILEVKSVVQTWKAQARSLKLSSADIALMEPAFNSVN